MDQQLKQRLIGVTVIVSLIVIFVPMLFDEKVDAPDGTAIEETIPPDPGSASREIPLPPGPPQSESSDESGRSAGSSYRIVPLSDPADSGAKTAKSEEAAEDQEKSAPLDEEQPSIEDSQRSEIRGAEDQDPAGGKSPDEAPAKPKPAASKSSADKPAVAGAPDQTRQKTKTRPARTGKREASGTKPRTADRTAAARSARSDGQKTPDVAAGTPAPEARPAESPPEPVSAWVVQAGSFTTEAKAKTLADKLRQGKFAAFVESVKGKKSVIYRVHVGPELDKARAEQLQKQLETNAGIKGIIVPHP
jgi:DedD protein